MNDDLNKSDMWDRWAPYFDAQWAGLENSDAVDFLARYARGGRVLELGAGTGRIAIDLAKNGLTVDGIEISHKMATIFQEKAQETSATVLVGDMVEMATQEKYQLIYCVFNSFLELLNQDRQVACFERAAEVVEPGGHFILETMCPLAGDLLWGRQQVAVRSLDTEHVSISATTNDPATQVLSFQEITFDAKGFRMLPVRLRYVWPSELDLMARISGFTLQRRVSSWTGDHFDSRSRVCISVYRR